MEEKNNVINQMEEPKVYSGIDLDKVEDVQRWRVLVVEDDADTVYLLKQLLRFSGFDVMSAGNGSEAIKKFIDYRPDLVLLDIMIPQMDGWEILDALRGIKKVPVIILSALNTKEDVVTGLRKGVDDYIGKPFHNEEVIERVKSVLRRTRKPRQVNHLEFPEVALEINLISQEVILDDQIISLTPKEFAVISQLAKNAPSVVSYEAIGKAVWGENSVEVRRRTKYLIYLIRKKFLKVNPSVNLILNFDRLGYKLLTSSNGK